MQIAVVEVHPWHVGRSIDTLLFGDILRQQMEFFGLDLRTFNRVMLACGGRYIMSGHRWLWQLKGSEGSKTSITLNLIG